jgi:hypothetical protein
MTRVSLPVENHDRQGVAARLGKSGIAGRRKPCPSTHHLGGQILDRRFVRAGHYGRIAATGNRIDDRICREKQSNPRMPDSCAINLSPACASRARALPMEEMKRASGNASQKS